jgi:hypothetical protein
MTYSEGRGLKPCLYHPYPCRVLDCSPALTTPTPVGFWTDALPFTTPTPVGFWTDALPLPPLPLVGSGLVCPEEKLSLQPPDRKSHASSYAFL